MGTLRDEMTKVLNEWDKADEQTSQPTKEITVEKQRGSISNTLISLVQANPGITTHQIRQVIEDRKLGIADDSVGSMLKQFTDRYVMHREVAEEKRNGRMQYQYFVLSPEEGKRRKAEDEKKLLAAQARMEKARQVKAAKEAARKQLDKMMEEAKHEDEERTGLRDLLPPSVATTSIYNTKPAPEPTWAVDSVINNLTVMQARQLYDALKEIFGG